MYYAKTEATMNLDDLKAYKLVRKENLSDIRSTGYLLRHIKTGARIMVIENDDDNKVFNIAFRQRTAPVLHTFWNTVYFADPEIFL